VKIIIWEMVVVSCHSFDLGSAGFGVNPQYGAPQGYNPASLNANASTIGQGQFKNTTNFFSTIHVL